MVILSILAAIIPTVLYVLVLWRLDKYEREPQHLFIAAFIWGAVPAIIASLVLEVISSLPLTGLSDEAALVAGTGVIAPVIEEACKAAALLLLFWFFRSEFDGVLDGIIYGSVVGFGFAMTENIIYYIGAWSEGGVQGWLSLILVRGVAFGLNHAMYTALTGAALGLARFRPQVPARWLVFLLGLGAAIVAHMLHNLLVAASGACLLGFLLDWAGVGLVLGIIGLSWRHERQIIHSYLAEEVNLGVLSEQLYAAAASPQRRLRASLRAPGEGGAVQAAVWTRLLETATELAFKKHQRATMGEERKNGIAVAELRSQLLQQRAFLGDQVAEGDRFCPRCGQPRARIDAEVCGACGGTLMPLKRL